MSAGRPLHVAKDLEIPADEISVAYTRSGGPGGQNVNKVATAVQLRFDVGNSPSLPGDVRTRLIRLAGRRITADGILVLDARRFRTQEANRADAIQRFVDLVRKAAEQPRPRRHTAPTQASREARLKQKRERGAIKSSDPQAELLAGLTGGWLSPVSVEIVGGRFDPVRARRPGPSSP